MKDRRTNERVTCSRTNLCESSKVRKEQHNIRSIVPIITSTSQRMVPSAKETIPLLSQFGNRKLIALELNRGTSFVPLFLWVYIDESPPGWSANAIYSLFNVTPGCDGLIYGSICLFLSAQRHGSKAHLVLALSHSI